MSNLNPLALRSALLISLGLPVAAFAADPDVAFGTKHGVALRNNGEVLTWGDNVFCQLGRRSKGNSDPNPVVIMRNVKYELTNLKPGAAERAIGVKSDPTFPDLSEPNRIQVIAVAFSFGAPDPRHTVQLRAWGQRIKDSFDFAALAALLQ